jgi:DNA-binding helix-hairpin-helix protein with protein kinase domain
MNLFRGAHKAPVKLGKELGRGGEGAVFLVAGAPGLVAKVYFRPPSTAKADKLRAMSKHAMPALLRAAAWPADVLTDDSGTVRGFLMARIDAREDLHELYSPKSRRRAFPDVDFRFVVRVATNLARAFGQVHAQGSVIGDVNHGNALVGRDGTVVLIDCDSFQVRHAGRTFTCDVGVPLFTPPELAGRGFRGLARSANHDAFGLAVLLFHLLFLGRHPFAGRFVDGEMPIERAIAESRFAYGPNAPAKGMTAPPGTLALDAFGSKLAKLFEAAFAAPGEGTRPPPGEWVDALQALEADLTPCEASAAHFRPRGTPNCCWCAHEKRTGMQVFGRQLADAVSLGSMRIARLWDTIAAIPRPLEQPRAELPPLGADHYMAPDALGSKARGYLGVVLGLFGLAALKLQPGGTAWSALAYFAVAVACFWPSRKLTVEAAVLRARAQVELLVDQWNALSADTRFDQLLKRLEEIKQRLIDLPQLRAQAIKTLAENAAQRQRDRFLALFRIDKAAVPALTGSDIAMLASHGIDSADDVLRVAPHLWRYVSDGAAWELEAWANRQAERFHFDPASGADPANLRETDALLLAQQEQFLATLRDGERELRRLASELEARRLATRRDLQQARAQLADAEKELA